MTPGAPEHVVDTSVAIKWVVDEGDSDLAERLRGRSIAAPAFMLTECANMLRSGVAQRRLARADAEAGLALLAAWPLRWFDDRDLVQPAFGLAVRLGEAVYDCIFLALAMQLGAPLVTADRRFLAVARRDASLRRLVVPLDLVS